ncbi:MAG: DNA recombination protein RmuC [Rhodothalassiaceae bacterium]
MPWLDQIDATAAPSLALAAMMVFLAGLAIGLVAGRWGRGRLERELAETRQDLVVAEQEAARLAPLEGKLAEQAELLTDLRIERADLSRTIAERERALAAERAELDQRFKLVAGHVLQESRDQFLALAGQSFEKHKAMAKSDLDQLIKPMAETLEQYRKNLAEIEKARTDSYGSLRTELKQVAEAQAQVRDEAKRLATALRDGAGVRGRWGEQQLKRILELAGMAQYVDFDCQVAVQDAEGRGQKPDAVIRLPADRVIVVDAKVPMSAYIDARNETDPERRTDLFREHARQVRAQMKALAKKGYAGAFEEALDSVVMFLPTEDLAATAWEHDAALYEDAFRARVLIATPTTLFALAKAVAHVWRNERAAKNAHEVARLGRDLHDRVAAMAGHVRRLGSSLDTSVKHYNGFVGSLERKVLPATRKFKDLEIVSADADDLGLDAVDNPARPLAAPELATEPYPNAAE